MTYLLTLQVKFEGTQGTGLYGDIGLDDIQLLPDTQGKCPTINACTFEYLGLCSFTNTLMGDQFDWERHKGTTSSGNTGPAADHTMNNKNG